MKKKIKFPPCLITNLQTTFSKNFILITEMSTRRRKHSLILRKSCLSRLNCQWKLKLTQGNFSLKQLSVKTQFLCYHPWQERASVRKMSSTGLRRSSTSTSGIASPSLVFWSQRSHSKWLKTSSLTIASLLKWFKQLGTFYLIRHKKVKTLKWWKRDRDLTPTCSHTSFHSTPFCAESWASSSRESKVNYRAKGLTATSLLSSNFTEMLNFSLRRLAWTPSTKMPSDHISLLRAKLRRSYLSSTSTWPSIFCLTF